MTEKILTPQELEEKHSELKEKYNFKYDNENECYSFEYKTKKAFFIDLSDPDHSRKVTPYFMRRGQLKQIIDYMYDNEEGMNKIDSFLGSSIEIIGNMLDDTKMGSVENFINLIWEDMKEIETADRMLKYIEVFGNIISMIDIAVEAQLKDVPIEHMKKLHDEYFSNRIKVFAIGPDGEVKDIFGHTSIEDDNPDPKYDLKNMTPLNTKEI